MLSSFSRKTNLRTLYTKFFVNIIIKFHTNYTQRNIKPTLIHYPMQSRHIYHRMRNENNTNFIVSLKLHCAPRARALSFILHLSLSFSPATYTVALSRAAMVVWLSSARPLFPWLLWCPFSSWSPALPLLSSSCWDLGASLPRPLAALCVPLRTTTWPLFAALLLVSCSSDEYCCCWVGEVTSLSRCSLLINCCVASEMRLLVIRSWTTDAVSVGDLSEPGPDLASSVGLSSFDLSPSLPSPCRIIKWLVYYVWLRMWKKLNKRFYTNTYKRFYEK